MFTLKRYLTPIFIVIATTIVITYGIKYGDSQLKKTYDSYDYGNASEGIAIYLNGRNADGVSFLQRPPIIPAYLYFFKDKDQAAKWLNFSCFLIALWLAFLLGRAAGLSVQNALGYSLVVAIFYPWLQNFFFLWSEPLFGMLALLLVLLLVESKPVGFIIFICLLLYFTRKAGLFLSGGALFVYLLNRKFDSAILIGVALGVACIGWELLTFHFADESTSGNIFLQLVYLNRFHYADAITGWFFPRVIPLWWRIVLMITLTILLYIYYKKEIATILSFQKVRIVLIILATYLLSFFILFGTPDYHEAERFTSIMIPFVMLLVTLLIQEASFGNQVKNKLILILFFVWILYPISRTLIHLNA